MCKLRDYGSKRVEQLWEGYERQVNRLKMFSLHQRLNLMRKYKVKQKYLNKLVAKFADNSSQQAFMKPVNFIKTVIYLFFQSITYCGYSILH